MKNVIKNLKISKLNNTNFIKPMKIFYNLNGKDKSWEAIKSFDSVSILLYHKELDSFLLVKQFRAPVYLNNNEVTFTYELCAGILDKDISIKEAVKEEIDEECGYDVPLEAIEKISSFYTSVGICGTKQHMYFAQINENMKVHCGGGVNDEEIELYFLKLKDIREFMFDETKAKTSGLMFSFYWFLENKKDIIAKNKKGYKC